MNSVLQSWDRACADSSALRFLDINLRGTGQVMFQNHPLTGLLFLAAIGWGSFAGGAPEVFFGAVLGLLTATLTAMWLRVDADNLRAGLYGYNGILVGLALPTFLAPSPLLWGYVMLGAAVSVVAMLGTANVTKAWSVSALTFPFVITTWLLLLASHGYGGLDGSALSFSAEIVPIDPAASNPLDVAGFVQGMLRSISQVFLKGDALSALLLLAGLALNSLPAAVFALGGALVAVITAHALGAESELISAGLLGFSPVLTAIALGTVFYAPSTRVVLYVLLGTVFTVIVQGAMNVALGPLGIPALTAPFVLSSWLFLLPRQHLGGATDAAAG
jgi:urea transporter